MAKHALNLFIKIALFAAVMLLVLKTVHYVEWVNDVISQHISYDNAQKIGKIMSGEPDPEPYEAIDFYISVLINMLISVPILSAIFTAYNGVIHKVSPAYLPEEWALSTLRRLAKIFGFAVLFWALFRFLPYQYVFPDHQTYSSFTMAAIVGFNLLLTIACYRFITKKIISKKSL